MRLTITDITPGAADPAVGHLLSDLAEACTVYERVYGAVVDGEATVLGLSADAADAVPAPPALPPGARVYAVCVTGAPDPATAAVALDDLARRCEAAGLRWMGGLAVADGPVVTHAARSPRMGWRRRRVSEAVDRLVAAIRSGTPAPAELVRPSRYARLVERLSRRGASSEGDDAAQPRQQPRL